MGRLGQSGEPDRSRFNAVDLLSVTSLVRTGDVHLAAQRGRSPLRLAKPVMLPPLSGLSWKRSGQMP